MPSRFRTQLRGRNGRCTDLFRLPLSPERRERLAAHSAVMADIRARAQVEHYWFLRGDMECELRGVVVLAGERNRRCRVPLPGDGPCGVPCRCRTAAADFARPPMGRWCWSSGNLWEILDLRGSFDNYKRNKARQQLALTDWRFGVDHWFLREDLGYDLRNVSVLGKAQSLQLTLDLWPAPAAGDPHG